MARAMFQVLVIPFRRKGANLEFAALRRSDCGAWQGISGGGEGSESIEDGAKRETMEEAGLPGNLSFIRLDATCSIPVKHFENPAGWPENLYVIPEYSFGVDCSGSEIMLSTEHLEIRWGSFEEISLLMTWDSNKTALWELNERLCKGDH